MLGPRNRGATEWNWKRLDTENRCRCGDTDTRHAADRDRNSRVGGRTHASDV